MDKTTLAIAIIALLISISAPIADRTVGDVLVNELKDYYVCILNNEISGEPTEFKGGISGTGYSGYPFIDSRKGAIRCGTTDNKGTWILLSKYAIDKGLDPYELLLKEEPEPEPEPKPFYQFNLKGTNWKCNPQGCIPD